MRTSFATVSAVVERRGQTERRQHGELTEANRSGRKNRGRYRRKRERWSVFDRSAT